MSILTELSNNKGTISSVLGKELAGKVLNGNKKILEEAVFYSSYEASDPEKKQIRAGAAKIVECVAEKKPELVSVYLDKLLGALSVKEPQTRWMIIRTFGFCALLNPDSAMKGLPFAEKYIKRKEGLCIASSADLYLGDVGALSKSNAKKVFPLLKKAVETLVYNEQDWILEAFIKIAANAGTEERKIMKSFAEEWQDCSRNSTVKRASKLLKLIE